MSTIFLPIQQYCFINVTSDVHEANIYNEKLK